jgi:hypothetical protein
MWRRLLKYLALLALTVLVATWIFFRLPIGHSITAEDYVHGKKFPHLWDLDLRARLVEEPLGNERLFLKNDRELWVSSEDYRKVYGGPHAMTNIRYQVYPVLAGFGLARILEATDFDDRRMRKELEMRNKGYIGLYQLTATDRFPPEYREAAYAVAGAVSKEGLKPKPPGEYYAEVHEREGGKFLEFTLWNEPTLKRRIALYDVEQKKVTMISGWK